MTVELGESMSLLDALMFVRQKYNKTLTPQWYNELLSRLSDRLHGEMMPQSRLYSWLHSSDVLSEISQIGLESVLSKVPLYVAESDMKQQQLDEVILETILGATNLNVAFFDIESVVKNIVCLLMTNWNQTSQKNEFLSARDVYNENLAAVENLTKKILNKGKL